MNNLAPVTPYDRVVGLIAARGLSAKGACRSAGIAPNVLAQAKGTRKLSLDSIEKLAPVLGVAVSELLGEAPAAGLRAPSGNEAHPLPAVAAVAPVIAAADGSVRMIPCDSVQPWAGNPRKLFDDAAIAELADSIFDKGVLQNLVVRAHPDRPGLFLIVAGERRWRAAQRLRAENRWPATRGAQGQTIAGEAGGATLPCRVVEAGDLEALTLAVLENLQRVDVAPLEEAEAFKTLTDAGIGTDDIAKAVRKTRRYVQLRLALATKLAAPVKKALADGKITAEHARALAMVPPDRQGDVLEEIEDGYIETAADVRDACLREMPHVSWAVFDRALYTGEMVGDTEGPGDGAGGEYFADIAQAEKLQKEAIDALVEKLKSEWGWVKTLPPNKYLEAWQYAKGKKGDPKAGVVVKLTDGLGVEIYEGLVPKDKAGDDAKLLDRPPTKGRTAAQIRSGAPADPVEKRHLIRARQRKTWAIQEGVAANPMLAVRIALLGLIGADDIMIRTDHAGADDKAVAKAVVDGMAPVARIFSFAKDKRLRDCADDDDAHEKNDGKHYLPWIHVDEEAFAAALDALLDLPDDEVLAAFAAAVAARCGSWNRYRPGYGDGPVALALARVLGIAGKEYRHGLHMSADDLIGIRRDTLAGIAVELGGSAVGAAKEIRTRLTFQIVDMDRHGDGYVLPTMRFDDEETARKGIDALAVAGMPPKVSVETASKKKSTAKPADKKKPAAKPRATAAKKKAAPKKKAATKAKPKTKKRK